MDRGATKRIVAPGAAWTKPTVVAAAAAPVLATSGCPALTAHGSITGAGVDRITLTNTGSEPILSIGTTITWAIQNASGANRTYRLCGLVGMTASPMSLSVASGATTTFTFTLTSMWLPGSSVGWEMTVGTGLVDAWVYQSRIRVTTVPCPAGRYHCVSGLGDSFAAGCPDGRTVRLTQSPLPTRTRPGYVGAI